MCIPLSRKHQMLFKSSWLIHPIRHQWCILVNWTLYPLYWVYSVRLTSIFCFFTNYNISVSHQTYHSKRNFVRATLKDTRSMLCGRYWIWNSPLTYFTFYLLVYFTYLLHRMRVKGSFYFCRSRKTSPFTLSLDNPVFRYRCLIRCYLHFGWEFSQDWQER